MAIKKTSREEILKGAIRLFKIRGYYNTSMANIAEACGLIKGSIYHHFKSKDEIGLESLKYIHHYFSEHIYAIADRSDLSDDEKVRLFVKKTDDYFLHSEGGCLLGNLALEVSAENLEFKEEIKSYFTNWENALAKILQNKYANNEAHLLAKEYVALTQGAIMMMNLYGTSKDYLHVGEKIIGLLR
ncbi:TetR/AcrR family transcriptional regulator [Sulfurimonas sp. HSL3-2]|uniref:TetR/AcrR family transcriptional regulator n=1 Tax=Hydrocurvibacter mobilis TaxID=3131936 RepID=UPI0031F9DBCC